jgi:serralysin
MAAPTLRSFGLTGDAVIDGMTHGYYWGLTADRTIDWSISSGFSGETWSNPASLVTHLQAELSTFSYFANVRFNYVGAYANPVFAANAGSEINISLDGFYFFSNVGVWAQGIFPDPQKNLIYPGAAGDVYLNVRSQANSLASYEPGSAGWFVFLHELGHVIGLKHPHDDGGTGRPTLSQLGMAGLDFDWATMMSYRDDLDWNLRQWDPASPMILDVLALQYIYGKNLATNAGNSTFSLSNTNLYSTLWDASGNDTVSAAGANAAWLIALPDQPLSRLVDTKVGFAMPVAEASLSSPHTLYWLAGDMENATGSSGNDVLIGNSFSNVLFGGGGTITLMARAASTSLNSPAFGPLTPLLEQAQARPSRPQRLAGTHLSASSALNLPTHVWQSTSTAPPATRSKLSALCLALQPSTTSSTSASASPSLTAV